MTILNKNSLFIPIFAKNAYNINLEHIVKFMRKNSLAINTNFSRLQVPFFQSKLNVVSKNKLRMNFHSSRLPFKLKT